MFILSKHTFYKFVIAHSSPHHWRLPVIHQVDGQRDGGGVPVPIDVTAPVVEGVGTVKASVWRVGHSAIVVVDDDSIS